jgi:hypothetical protein
MQRATIFFGLRSVFFTVFLVKYPPEYGAIGAASGVTATKFQHLCRVAFFVSPAKNYGY